MSKILVVEPRRMLQQAIALTLIPNHEVQLSATLPSAEARSNARYDVVVVDAAAVREEEGLSGEMVRALQESRIPTIWIENREINVAPKGNRFVIVKQPIQKDALLSAVAQCLSLPETAIKGNRLAPERAAERTLKTQPSESKARATLEEIGPQFIELVDVVEEGSAQENEQRIRRK